MISALHQGVLAKGVHEVCKAIESRSAKFCILAEDCSEGIILLDRQLQEVDQSPLQGK